jgi:hypothetical protein
MPARRSMLDNPAFQAATNPDRLALYQQIATLMADPRTVAYEIFGNRFNISHQVLQLWMMQAFDAYVLDDADLDAALADAQQKAQTFQTCAADLPPTELYASSETGLAALTAYVDCAEAVDSSLKPFFDPMVGR